MKIGLVGKDNYKGLGILTEEYMNHLPIHRLVCVGKNQRGRWKDKHIYTPDLDIVSDEFLDGLDVVIILETQYFNFIKKCKERGIKTILKVNYEFLREGVNIHPDMYLCSSTKNYDAVDTDNKVLIPDPVNTEKIPFRQRTRVKSILHNAGTLGIGGANGTYELLEAMRFVESDIKLYVHTQKKLELKPGNVFITNIQSEDYADLWGACDLYVSPQKFRATSLPIQEAMANGMPVLTTNIEPFNQFCHFLVEPSGSFTDWAERKIEVAEIDSRVLAKKLDELYDTDISKESKEAREYAESISWEALTPKILHLIQEVCTSNI